jgi:hypothetical protein
MHIFCSSDAILDPVVRSHVNVATFEQNSVLPCLLMKEQFKRDAVKVDDAANITAAKLVGNLTSRKLTGNLTTVCDSLGAPAECKYPKQDASPTRAPCAGFARPRPLRPRRLYG